VRNNPSVGETSPVAFDSFISMNGEAMMVEASAFHSMRVMYRGKVPQFDPSRAVVQGVIDEVSSPDVYRLNPALKF